jgi:hypothetical protein
MILLVVILTPLVLSMRIVHCLFRTLESRPQFLKWRAIEKTSQKHAEGSSSEEDGVRKEH